MDATNRRDTDLGSLVITDLRRATAHPSQNFFELAKPKRDASACGEVRLQDAGFLPSKIGQWA